MNIAKMVIAAVVFLAFAGALARYWYLAIFKPDRFLSILGSPPSNPSSSDRLLLTITRIAFPLLIVGAIVFIVGIIVASNSLR